MRRRDLYRRVRRAIRSSGDGREWRIRAARQRVGFGLFTEAEYLRWVERWLAYADRLGLAS